MVVLFCSGPLGRAVPCDVVGNLSSGWTVRWTPNELGVHSIDVEYGRHAVVGSPFTCKVFDLSRVIILHDQQLHSTDQSDDVVFYGSLVSRVLTTTVFIY